MTRKFLLLASLWGLVAGCAPTPNSIPTPLPPQFLPTVIAQTAESANLTTTQTHIAALPEIISTRTSKPTSTFTPAPTLTSTSIPGHEQSAILIHAPGPMSKVISPINVKMDIVTGKSQIVQIDLYGEDGRLLSRALKKNVPTSSNGVAQTAKIPFEIRAAAELGRISISTQDEFGRMQSLSSVRVLLLSSGENEITTPGNPSEPVSLFKPLRKETGLGGILNVRGDVWPFNTQPLILELIDPEGKSISLRVLTVDEVKPQLIETTLPYKISDPMIARLVIRQDDDRIDGLFYLFSREIMLNP